MRIRILAVGRLKAGPERDLCNRYVERLGKAGRPLGISSVSITEIAESRASSDAEGTRQEGEALLRALDRADIWYLLDERGESPSSEAFAASLDALRGRAVGEVAFVIGGAGGAGSAVRDAAPQSISFGRMTWPHQLVRIMLCEQLYRAATILAGHPYHRGG